jgi:hypothetical protein
MRQLKNRVPRQPERAALTQVLPAFSWCNCPIWGVAGVKGAFSRAQATGGGWRFSNFSSSLQPAVNKRKTTNV